MKKYIVKMLFVMILLSIVLMSCSTKENKSDSEMKRADMIPVIYNGERLFPEHKIGIISGCSLIDDDNILFTVCDDGDDKFYISDNKLNSFREMICDDDSFKSDYYEIKGSGDGKIWLLCKENSIESEDDNDYPVYKLTELNTDGSVISKNIIDPGEFEDCIKSLCDMTVWNDKFIFKSVENGEIRYLVADSNGKITGELEYKMPEFMESLCISDDNILAALGQKGVNDIISFYDNDNFKVSDTVIVDKSSDADFYNITRGMGDSKFYAFSDSMIFVLNHEARIVEALDISNILDYHAEMIVPQENGDYILIGFHNSNINSLAVYRLTKLSDDEISNIKVVTIGSFGFSSELKEMVNDFNSMNDGIRLKVIDYENQWYDEASRLDGLNNMSFNKDVISGNIPDMFFSNSRSNNVILGNKEILADLYEFMDNDKEFSRQSVLENVLTACEMNGKLISIAPSFSISTMAAKKKWVDIENWTVDDASAVYDSLSNDMSFISSDSREDIAELLIYAISENIDTNKSKCYFDSEQFCTFMKFAEKFKPSGYNNNIDELENGTINDKILLASMYLSDFRGYLEDKTYLFGEDDICFTGFPSQKKSGAGLNFTMNFSIYKKSENKDICWEFIKGAFKEFELSSLLDYGSFPSLKSNFYKLADDITKVPVYEDENGALHEKKLSVEIDGKIYDISPLSEEEKNKYVDYITGINHDGMDIPPNALSIITEEMQKWIYDEISTEEFIENIQKRVTIVLSE